MNAAHCVYILHLVVWRHWNASWDVIKWKHFQRYWPFVREIHRSAVNSPHKGQWRGALMYSLICVWINGWVNNRKAGQLRRHRAHYDVIVMETLSTLLADGWRYPSMTWGFPSQWAVMRSFHVFFDGSSNKVFKKQFSCRWLRRQRRSQDFIKTHDYRRS